MRHMPGERWKPSSIDWNRHDLAADLVLNGRSGAPVPTLRSDRPYFNPTWAWVYNDTGSDRLQYDCVEIADFLYAKPPLPGVNFRNPLDQTVLHGLTPIGNGRPAVYQDFCAYGDIGLAVVNGMTWARCSGPGDADNAPPIFSTTGYLRVKPYSNYKMVGDPAGNSSVVIHTQSAFYGIGTETYWSDGGSHALVLLNSSGGSAGISTAVYKSSTTTSVANDGSEHYLTASLGFPATDNGWVKMANYPAYGANGFLLVGASAVVITDTSIKGAPTSTAVATSGSAYVRVPTGNHIKYVAIGSPVIGTSLTQKQSVSITATAAAGEFIGHTAKIETSNNVTWTVEDMTVTFIRTG